MRRLCESAFRHEDFQILETQGSTEWNKEGFNALARVVMKLVKSMLFQRNDMNTCIYERFSDNFGLVEQHGDDFLVCGPSSVLECLADEFKKHFR